MEEERDTKYHNNEEKLQQALTSEASQVRFGIELIILDTMKHTNNEYRTKEQPSPDQTRQMLGSIKAGIHQSGEGRAQLGFGARKLA